MSEAHAILLGLTIVASILAIPAVAVVAFAVWRDTRRKRNAGASNNRG